MKYVLSEGTVLRREWFGCLCYQSYNGNFWQFNEDAFEILRHLKNPVSLVELKNSLYSKEMMIDNQALQEYLDSCELQGLISQREEASEIILINEGKTDFRKDCLSVPSSVTIYITDFCPKCCRHCATNAHDRINIKDELMFSDWVKILQILREAGVMVLVFSGGEPLAIEHTEKILKLADDMQFGLSILTDYDSISNQQISNLKSLKHPLNIQTSLDGAVAETHDFLRGKGSFVKTLNRFQKLKNAGMIFTVSVSVHKKNIGELEEIADLANRYGASFIYLNAVAPYGRAKETMKDYLLDEADLKLMAQTCLRWAAGNKIKSRNPFWGLNLDHLGDDDFHPFSGTLNAMSLGIYNFTINSKGNCYLDAKQRAEDFLFLGNILETDFREMWSDPRLDVLRSMKSQEMFTYANQSKIEAALASK